MDDLSSMISNLLSSPDAADTIKNLVGALGTANSEVKHEEKHEEKHKEKHTEKEADNSGGLDIDMMLKLAPLLSSFGQDDENTTLLHALRPHLNDERKGKLDKAAKLMRLAKLLPLLGEGSLF